MAKEHKVAVDTFPPQPEKENKILIGVPNTCPICHYSINPYGPFSPAYCKQIEDENIIIQAYYRCVRSECGSLFIGQYFPTGNAAKYKFKNCVPRTAKNEVFESQITELSPSFVKIYNQSLEAEAMNLDEISGVGLRKAFEFLIKDYCISKHPDEEDKIKRIFLGQCINDYIEDTRIKQCAEKVAWLGNDETHYVRKWEDKDISDLKALIQLSLHWIASEKLTEDYMKSFEQTDQQSE